MGLIINRQCLFYISCIAMIIGFSLLGLGIGLLITKFWESLIIGFAMGLLLVSCFAMRTYRRLQVYDKNKI